LLHLVFLFIFLSLFTTSALAVAQKCVSNYLPLDTKNFCPASEKQSCPPPDSQNYYPGYSQSWGLFVNPSDQRVYCLGSFTHPRDSSYILCTSLFFPLKKCEKCSDVADEVTAQILPRDVEKKSNCPGVDLQISKVYPPLPETACQINGCSYSLSDSIKVPVAGSDIRIITFVSNKQDAENLPSCLNNYSADLVCPVGGGPGGGGGGGSCENIIDCGSEKTTYSFCKTAKKDAQTSDKKENFCFYESARDKNNYLLMFQDDPAFKFIESQFLTLDYCECENKDKFSCKPFNLNKLYPSGGNKDNCNASASDFCKNDNCNYKLQKTEKLFTFATAYYLVDSNSSSSTCSLSLNCDLSAAPSDLSVNDLINSIIPALSSDLSSILQKILNASLNNSLSDDSYNRKVLEYLHLILKSDISRNKKIDKLNDLLAQVKSDQSDFIKSIVSNFETLNYKQATTNEILLNLQQSSFESSQKIAFILEKQLEAQKDKNQQTVQLIVETSNDRSVSSALEKIDSSLQTIAQKEDFEIDYSNQLQTIIDKMQNSASVTVEQDQSFDSSLDFSILEVLPSFISLPSATCPGDHFFFSFLNNDFYFSYKTLCDFSPRLRQIASFVGLFLFIFLIIKYLRV
jgi:hypothetical protein